MADICDRRQTTTPPSCNASKTHHSYKNVDRPNRKIGQKASTSTTDNRKRPNSPTSPTQRRSFPHEGPRKTRSYSIATLTRLGSTA